MPEFFLAMFFSRFSRRRGRTPLAFFFRDINFRGFLSRHLLENEKKYDSSFEIEFLEIYIFLLLIYSMCDICFENMVALFLDLGYC